VVGAGADDHFALSAHRLQDVVAQHLDADRPPALQDDPGGQGIGVHLDVSAFGRWVKVRDRCAAAPSVSLCELKPARALLRRPVVIIGGCDPRLHRRLDARPDHRLHRSAIAHAQRPTDAVPIALPALVVLRAAEVGQHILIAPAGKAHRHPPVVVGAVAANVDHAVQRARPPQHAPAWQQVAPVAQFRLALAPQPPVKPALPQLPKRQRHVDDRLVVRGTGLDHGNPNVRILAQPRRQHATGRTGTDDHIVKHGSPSAPGLAHRPRGQYLAHADLTTTTGARQPNRTLLLSPACDSAGTAAVASPNSS
jgi:hypothetical protein